MRMAEENMPRRRSRPWVEERLLLLLSGASAAGDPLPAAERWTAQTLAQGVYSMSSPSNVETVHLVTTQRALRNLRDEGLVQTTEPMRQGHPPLFLPIRRPISKSTIKMRRGDDSQVQSEPNGETYRRIRELAAEGLTQVEISRQVGVTRERVRQIVTKYGIPVRYQGSAFRTKTGARMSIAQQAEALKPQILALREGGSDIREIAAQLKLSYTRTCELCRMSGIKLRFTRKATIGPRVSQLLELYRSGVKVKDIAERLGYANSASVTVAAHVRGVYRANTYFRRCTGAYPAVIRLVELGLSAKQVCDALGVTPRTVYKACDAEGVPHPKSGQVYSRSRRDPSEDAFLPDLLSLLSEGKPVGEAARMCGISRGTAAFWAAQVQEEAIG